ncbi:hypothetical protein DSO57_1026201 [Entomophthora muscae]|uniref:Uncharacterized protein n=1 Tax=Entomophthora muscae TaxID=34485 RepID=A0ACC2SF45_9FUNG|nr:hypothetical protein DSO57_1026201 [Entomophthora muscae]
MESEHKAMSDQDELAFWRAKVVKLETRLQTTLDEKMSYERKLRDSVEQRADLEANHTALQMEFEKFKATVRETMTPNMRLQRDMERLAEKLIDEAELRSELEYSKQLVEAELEDLTRNLFEEANRMVAEERIKTAQLRQELETLKLTHKQTLFLLSSYKEQSIELKLQVKELGDQEPPIRVRRSGSLSTLNTPSSLSTTSSPFRDSGLSRSSTETASPTSLSFSPEDFRFVEFKDFLDAPANLGSHLNSRFMKRSMAEEVEPTIKFEASGFFFGKRLLTAVQNGTVNIYLTCKPRSTSWRSTLGLNSKQAENPQCSLCTSPHPTYQFTLQEGDTPKPACPHCRLRLVSAVQFFTYHRHSRTGLIKGSPQKLYLGSLNTKLMMFLARSGAHTNELDSDQTPQHEIISPYSIDTSIPA